MTADTSAAPAPAPPESEPLWPPYPEYGTDAYALARMRILVWIPDQLGPGKIEANPGDYVLATDGRILGVGPDEAELDLRVLAAEPELRHARLVVTRIPYPDR